MADINDWEDLPLAANEDDWEDQPIETNAQPSEISKAQSALKGSQQGLTMGFSDEIGGAIQSGMDKVAGLFGESPSEVNARLAAEGTTGDVGPTSSGEMYDVARDEERDALKAARDANPWSYGLGEVGGGALTLAVPGLSAAKGASVAQQAAKAGQLGAAYGLGSSEEESLAGMAKDTAIGGVSGYGLGRLFPKLFSKEIMGRGANFADTATRFGKAAGVGAGAGSLIGAATSMDEDLSSQEGWENLGSNVLKGATLGAAGGIGLRGIGSAAYGLADSQLGQKVKQAINLGKGGENITSPEFATSRQDKIEGLTDEVKGTFDRQRMLAEKLEREAAEQAALETKLANERAQKLAKDAESKLGQIESEIKGHLEQKQIATNQQDYNKYTELNKDLAGKAQGLERIIGEAQRTVGQGIDAVSDEIGKNRNLRINTDDIVNTISGELNDLSHSTGIDYQKVIDDMTRFAGDLDFDGFRQFKEWIKNQAKFNKPGSPYSSVFKVGYGKLNSQLEGAAGKLIQEGAEAGADVTKLVNDIKNLRLLNQKYSASRELENVIDRAKNLYSIGEKTGEQGNIPFLRRMGSAKAETLQPQEQFGTLLNTLAPESAPQFLQETQQTAQGLRRLGDIPEPAMFEPKVTQSAVKEALEEVPEVAQLREQLKPETITIEPTVPEIGLKARARADQFQKDFGDDNLSGFLKTARVIEKGSDEYSISARKKLNELLSQYEQVKGTEAAKGLEDEIRRVSSEYALGREATMSPEGYGINKQGLLKSVLGTATDLTVKGGNQYGLAVKGIADIASKIKDNAYLQRLSSAAMGKSPELSRILSNMSAKDVVGRNATMFLIMQNPGYRKQMEDLSVEMGEE